MARKRNASQVADPFADPEQDKAVADTLVKVRKQFGENSVFRFGDGVKRVDVASVSSGSLAIDSVLGIGGFPRGRIVELYGPEGAGKTLVSLHAIREAQKDNGVAAFVDAEHAFDVDFARRIGVDVDKLILAQPDSGEQGLEIVDFLVKSKNFTIIVVDSVAALVPQAELDGEMGDSHMGLHARLMSQALRKLTGSISQSNTCVIFINQIRMKIGVMFGNPETTTGGRALSFYSSVRMEVRGISHIKDGDTIIGRRTRAKVVKNKVAPPFGEAEFDIYFLGDDVGISKESDLIDMGVQHKIVDKNGAWFSYAGEKLGQGKESARRHLRDNPKIARVIERKIREVS